MNQLTEKVNIKQILSETFREYENKLNGRSQSSLHQIRKKAMNTFEDLGFPGVKNEEYKYTQISRFLEKEFDFKPNFQENEPEFKEFDSHLLKGIDANEIFFLNGRLIRKHSNIKSSEKEVIIYEFSEAFEKDKESFDNHFSRFADIKNDPFIALNTAFARNGIYLRIPDNVVVEKPIIIYQFVNAEGNRPVVQPRNLIVAGRNSQVKIIEFFISLGSEKHFTNIVSEVVAEENSHLEYYKIMTDNENACHVGTTQIYQEGHSTVTAFTVASSGLLVRNNLNVVVDGEGCEANLFGLSLLNGKEHVDNHTLVDHRKPNSNSNELYKGIFDDDSTGVFNGKIYVRQIAQKTNAFQSNKNILLSDNATINTKPQLEIWADDVKCSHGATTGQMDEEQLFYLRARGLGESSARALLLHAFAADVLEHISIQPLKDHLDQLISERLHKDLT